MAKIQTNGMINVITGKIDSNIITRVKKYRDPITGEILRYGVNEYYIMRKKPVTNSPKQIKTRQKLIDASKIANEILCNKEHPRYKKLYDAFIGQIHSENAKLRFDNFVRSTIYREMTL